MADVTLNRLPESRTVTFGDPSAPTAEERLNSNWHIKFIGLFIGLPAATALAYVALMNASLAAGLATTIVWKIGIGLLVAVLTLSLGALPIAVGLLKEEKSMGPAAWAALILLSMILAFSIFSTGSHAYYAMHQRMIAPAASTPNEKPLLDFDPFNGKRFRFENERNGRWYEFGVKDLVRRTNGCRDLSYDPFEYQFQREFCKDWRTAEQNERRRMAGLSGAPVAEEGEIEGLFSAQARNYARWFLAVWGPMAALLFSLLGFAVAGGAISKMLLISEPSAPEQIVQAPIGRPEIVIDNDTVFEDWCEQCVGLNANARGLTPTAIWQSFDKWTKTNGYGTPPFGKEELWKRFKAKYGSKEQGYFKHSGSTGGSQYDGLILRG